MIGRLWKASCGCRRAGAGGRIYLRNMGARAGATGGGRSREERIVRAFLCG
jgi:hypothetical protein